MTKVATISLLVAVAVAVFAIVYWGCVPAECPECPEPLAAIDFGNPDAYLFIRTAKLTAVERVRDGRIRLTLKYDFNDKFESITVSEGWYDLNQPKLNDELMVSLQKVVENAR